MKNILITGGAGYIGSHTAKQLLENTDFNIYIVDNLSTGYQKTIDTLSKIRKFNFIKLDLNDYTKVNDLLKNNNIDTIIHFAASIVVPESINNPLKYYMNNTVNSINLINCAMNNNVGKFIFSSTAAVYGEPKQMLNSELNEDSELSPINPYGQSKLAVEKVLQDVGVSNKNFKYVIFRYFNVSGADMCDNEGAIFPRIGECHNPETHLIPLVIKTALKKRDSITIFGEDYDTPDGTCIRDYIHVDDLANAHIKAIDYLENNSSDIFNCGYGHGYSVKEIINKVRSTTNMDLKVIHGDRRDGDPSVLVSNNRKIKEKMNWNFKFDNLELIIKSAYNWEKSLN